MTQRDEAAAKGIRKSIGNCFRRPSPANYFKIFHSLSLGPWFPSSFPRGSKELRTRKVIFSHVVEILGHVLIAMEDDHRCLVESLICP